MAKSQMSEDVSELHEEKKMSSKRFPALWSRRWWLLVFTPVMILLVLLILLLLLFLVIVPVVARSHAKSTTITMESLVISSPTNTGFTVSGRQSLSSIPLNPTIDAFTLQVADMNKMVLFNMSTPTFKGTEIVVDEQEVSIISYDAYVNFSRQLLQQKETQLRVYGMTKVNVLTRSVPITMDTIVAVGGLKDLTVAVANVIANNGTFDANAKTTYESSPISLDLGESKFQLLFEDALIANLTGAVNLEPGTQDFNTTGTVIITGLAANATKFKDFQNLLASNASVPVVIQGLSNDQSTWADPSLQAFTRNTTITAAQMRTAMSSLGLSLF